MPKFQLNNAELASAVSGRSPQFPKYTTQIMNLANHLVWLHPSLLPPSFAFDSSGWIVRTFRLQESAGQFFGRSVYLDRDVVF